MTELMVMRHGEASWDAPTDPARELTPRGECCARNAGRYLNQIDWRPDLLICSPYTRARQTLAAVHLSFAGVPVQIAAELTPDHSVAQVCEFLNRLSQRRALIIGHQPLIGSLLGWLLHGDVQQQPAMDTASLALLSADGFMSAGAELQWLKTAAAYSALL